MVTPLPVMPVNPSYAHKWEVEKGKIRPAEALRLSTAAEVRFMLFL